MSEAKKDESDLSALLCVGDMIEFDFFGEIGRGKIQQVGKHGYWIVNTVGCVGTGSIRCDFDKAVKLNT